MIDKKYYDILNLVTWNNILDKCFEFLAKNTNCENLELEIWKKSWYTQKEIEKFKIPIIWNYYLMSNLTNYDVKLNYYDNEDYLKKTTTKRIKKINKMINHFIKNNNFSNEFNMI